jgi:preprotein translocase subunit SecF
MNIPFIKYYKVWLSIAIVTVVACIISLVVFGLKPGIDFTGGSLIEYSFSTVRPAPEEVEQAYHAVLGEREVFVQKTGERNVIVRSTFLDEETHKKINAALEKRFNSSTNKVAEEQVEAVGAVISQQLRSKAIWAIILVNVSIIAYLAYAFRKVARPVASWKYGLMAIVALVHDVLLVLGVFALLGHYRGVEVDIAFVVAVLTVLGYSVNDTIVVYDRIRENILHHTAGSFAEVVNRGLNETLMRSLNTTFTVLLPLGALLVLGGASVHTFTLALIIGMASGAYSSIFIAAPLLVLAAPKEQIKS